MRDDLERVNVVLTKEQHLRFREYSRRYQGSVSQFLRLAGEKELNRNNGTEELKLRPIFEQLEKTSTNVQAIQRTLQKLEKRRQPDYVRVINEGGYLYDIYRL